MTPDEIAAVKAEHWTHLGAGCLVPGFCTADAPHCLPYRLAVEAERWKREAFTQAEDFERMRAEAERLAQERDEARWERDAAQSKLTDEYASNIRSAGAALIWRNERDEALAEVERLAGKVARYETSTERWSITGTWLVEATGEHNCGTGPDGHYGAHEPMCGYEPVVNLAHLQGFDALADPKGVTP